MGELSFECDISRMDVKSFIRSLARCHPSQVVPLLRSGNETQWLAIKELCDHGGRGGLHLKRTKLPRASRRWFHGVINNRHSSIRHLKRSSVQRGGSKAELVGTVLKTLARAAAPHLKSAGKQVAKKVALATISKGVQALGDKIKSTPSKEEEVDSVDPKDDNDEELLKILNE